MLHGCPRPVPGGLADHPDFLLYINLAESTAAPRFKLSVFGELRLNNGGLLAAEKIARYFANPLIHCLSLPPDRTMYILVQLAAKATREERRAHQKAVKKQARSENDQPPSNLVSILVCLGPHSARVSRSAALPSCFTCTLLSVLRGFLVQLRFDDIRCFGCFQRCSHPWT